MSGSAYYNEIDPYAAQWLRNLIAAGHIAPGDVDERSIVDVQPDDLKSYTQAHFFAGIGGWSYAARLAGWPDDRPLWTGSCPCQPFSVAGKGAGASDERHLWPVFFGLIRTCRPDVVMGEQVAAAVGKDWLDGVSADLEGIGYACRATVVPACAVDAPHRRDRLWFVADADGGRQQVASDVERQQRSGKDRQDNGTARPNPCRDVPDPERQGWVSGTYPGIHRREESEGSWYVEPFRRASPWDGASFAVGADGKARRVEPGIRLLAYGVPARVGKLRAYGNAIVPQVAAEVIGAYIEARMAA